MVDANVATLRRPADDSAKVGQTLDISEGSSDDAHPADTVYRPCKLSRTTLKYFRSIIHYRPMSLS